MKRRWSKLQKTLYDLLLIKELNLQLHCTTYPIRDGWNGKGQKRGMPRYWFTIGKDIVWDWPKDFKDTLYYYEFHGWPTPKLEEGQEIKYNKDGKPIPPRSEKYGKSTTTIANLIEEYINTSKKDLLDKDFKYDKWGFTEILKSSDRRFGKKSLEKFKEEFTNELALKLIEQRLKK